MLHAVRKQVLQELSQPAPVGPDRLRRLHDECRVGGRDVRPTALGERREIDRLQVADALAAPGESQQVVDQRRHAVVGAGHVVEMLGVAVLARQARATLCDVQWVSQVVRDDAGELLQPFFLAFERLSLVHVDVECEGTDDFVVDVVTGDRVQYRLDDRPVGGHEPPVLAHELAS